MSMFGAKRDINLNGSQYEIFDIRVLGSEVNRLPRSLKVLLENLLRQDSLGLIDSSEVTEVLNWLKEGSNPKAISYMPSRVLMQDFTGVPAVVDIASMRSAMHRMGKDVSKINPLIDVDLVVDHSVQVDVYGNSDAFRENVEREMLRNNERYELLKWGQESLSNFRVVPPGTGICHQVNIEYLADVVRVKSIKDKQVVYPDTVVGTDSHTTMVNALSVLGWGVGGIEAEAAMLGQSISMLIPDVIGFKLNGKLKEGVTATDLVLYITQILRKKGVVGKFVEFYGPGLDELSLEVRATISNMAPEYGATVGYFPIDDKTIDYLKLTSRKEDHIKLVKEYAKIQGFWRDDEDDILFTETVELDISKVESSLAGPKRPQDRVSLGKVIDSYKDFCKSENISLEENKSYAIEGMEDGNISHGAVVIAAITSCTNTSNPHVMIGAALVAKKAVEMGLSVKPWVKTSLAPGSKVVTDYLNKADLQKYFDSLGFHLVGYGCTTCIGNSGPLKPEIEKCIEDNNLVVGSVLSGNRNFEGRIHPLSKVNYLASPLLVVIYAIAGTLDIDLLNDPVAITEDGKEVFLKDIWPSNEEIEKIVWEVVSEESFANRYSNVFEGDASWQSIDTGGGAIYRWDSMNTYVQEPEYFMEISESKDTSERDVTVNKARILLLLGDSITTDHISPAGNIAVNSAAAQYLEKQGISKIDYNSYGSRRGNHNVMVRGTFANIRIKNEIMKDKSGGYTINWNTGKEGFIYDVAMDYKDLGDDMVVIAGKEYGTGSSRDWAAKGTKLLGIKIVVAESFERIHRSNLIGMGVVPMEFSNGVTKNSLNLKGSERITVVKKDIELVPNQEFVCKIEREDGTEEEIILKSRIDTLAEVEYVKKGGILNKVLLDMI